MDDSQSAPNPGTLASPVQIHRADPSERRRTFWIVLVVLVLGIGMMLLLQRELAAIRGWLSAGETQFATQRFLIVARAALGLLALIGVICGGVVGHSAIAIIRERRYPHSRARLIRDREIIEGDRALLTGRLGLILAAAFVVAGIVGAVYGWTQLASF